MKHFIEECLLEEKERPSAGELLEHPLMQAREKGGREGE